MATKEADILRVFDSKSAFAGERLRPRQFGATTNTGEMVMREPNGEYKFIGARGPQGATGPQGIPGPQGEPGVGGGYDWQPTITAMIQRQNMVFDGEIFVGDRKTNSYDYYATNLYLANESRTPYSVASINPDGTKTVWVEKNSIVNKLNGDGDYQSVDTLITLLDNMVIIGRVDNSAQPRLYAIWLDDPDTGSIQQDDVIIAAHFGSSGDILLGNGRLLSANNKARMSGGELTSFWTPSDYTDDQVNTSKDSSSPISNQSKRITGRSFRFIARGVSGEHSGIDDPGLNGPDGPASHFFSLSPTATAQSFLRAFYSSNDSVTFHRTYDTNRLQIKNVSSLLDNRINNGIDIIAPTGNIALTTGTASVKISQEDSSNAIRLRDIDDNMTLSSLSKNGLRFRSMEMTTTVNSKLVKCFSATISDIIIISGIINYSENLTINMRDIPQLADSIVNKCFVLSVFPYSLTVGATGSGEDGAIFRLTNPTPANWEFNVVVLVAYNGGR